MIIPVRCFTCGKEISSKHQSYLNKCKAGIHPKDALDQLGMIRICCRRMFLGHVDTGDKLLNHERNEL